RPVQSLEPQSYRQIDDVEGQYEIREHEDDDSQAAREQPAGGSREHTRKANQCHSRDLRSRRSLAVSRVCLHEAAATRPGTSSVESRAEAICSTGMVGFESCLVKWAMCSMKLSVTSQPRGAIRMSRVVLTSASRTMPSVRAPTAISTRSSWPCSTFSDVRNAASSVAG